MGGSSVATAEPDYTLSGIQPGNNCLWKSLLVALKSPLKWFDILSFCLFSHHGAETTVSDPPDKSSPESWVTSIVQRRFLSEARGSTPNWTNTELERCASENTDRNALKLFLLYCPWIWLCCVGCVCACVVRVLNGAVEHAVCTVCLCIDE